MLVTVSMITESLLCASYALVFDFALVLAQWINRLLTINSNKINQWIPRIMAVKLFLSPLAITSPLDSVSAQVDFLVDKSGQVFALMSTTAGGVPRRCVVPPRIWTARYG